MDDNVAREDACQEYQSSLEDLIFNSKPHINMLTILAEENLHFAKDIVAIIEAQIIKAPPAEKLPVLYLVDSIVKNVGGEYLAVFAKNLVTSFICVFEKVDENTRKSLFKLRCTWDDIFPLKKLYALDVRVNSLDPAWPIKPLPPTTNASIHVNPKFLKQSEDVSAQRASTPQPVAPPPQPVPSISEVNFTREQVIRQQLLAKQKQLLELQQKKIELELEHTKAQLAGGYALAPASPAVSAPAVITSVPKPASQSTPVIKPWMPPQNESKACIRDPRLNRPGPSAAPQPKEQPSSNKDSHSIEAPGHTQEKRLLEKTSKPEKMRAHKKDVLEEKLKSKSLSPMPKVVPSKNKHSETERAKPPEAAKKDARPRKRIQDKAAEAKEDELKEKKRCTDKQEKDDPARAPESQKSPKGKLVNGSLNKRERTESLEKAEFKTGGNARTNARKRTRSRSRSRSPTSSPKRKDRRSPKGRARSSSSSPPPSHKPSKARRVHTDETQHGKSSREDRPTPKKSLTEPRRAKRPADERHVEGRESHSPRGQMDSKENKDSALCWSGWKENKHLKPSEEPHGKPTLQRHKSYSGPPRPTTPRTPKHRLSVDANLQIPEVLNSASKRDLLRRASKRLESGEISQEDFLNVAHQIKQLFQYQEEMQRSDSYEASSEDGGQQKQFPVKKPLLPTRHSPQSHQADGMRGSDLSYHKHKSKQRRTLMSRQQGGEDWEGEASQDEEEGPVGKAGSNRDAMHPLPHINTRTPRDRQGERHSKEPEKHPPEQQSQVPMIEEYNHGKEFPKLKSLPGLRFRMRVDPRAPSEREWKSPLTERQCYDDRGEQKSGYDTARRYGAHPDSRHGDPRRQEPPPPPPMGDVSCPSPANLEGPARQSPVAAYEREPLSPLHPKDSGELSPVPRFESPNSEHSDDGPLNLDVPPPPRSILKQPSHSGPLASVRQHSVSPGHTPPPVSDGGHTSRYDGPSHMGPSRSHAPGRYESGPGRYDDFSRYDGPHQQGPGRFEGGRPPPHSTPERFNGPARYENHGPMRGGEGRGRPFEGLSHPQGSVRFNGPVGQQPPVRFDGQGPGPGHFDSPMQPNRFDRPQRFDSNMGPGPRPGPGPGPGPVGFQQPCPMRFNGPQNQMGPARFDGPSPPGPMHFHGPGQPGPRYDMPNMHPQGMPPRFSCPQEQQGPPRFGPSNNMQPPLQHLGPPNNMQPLGPVNNMQPLGPVNNMQPLGPPNNMQPLCPPNNMQPPLQPLGPPMYENPTGPPQQPNNFNMPNQCFPEPMNPQFAGGPLPFPAQQNVPQGGNFNVPPGPPFSQPAGPPFFNPGAPPAGNMQQPVNMMPNLAQPFLPQNPVPFRQPAPQFATPETHFGQVDVNDLLSKLISTGIIPAAKPSQPESVATTGPESPATPPVAPVVVEEEEEEEQELEEDDNPDLTGFVIDDMKQRYDSVVTKLYTGIQCYSCGMRFTASQTDVYADHLDWHYRQNRSEKDISKKVTHRHWYYSLTDWVEFEEIADLEERAKSQFFEKVNEEVVQKSQEAAKEKEFQSVKAATDVVAESCEICQEAFEMYWEEDEEEWHLRNAIRVDEKTYHPSCFEDYKNTSMFLDTTPSPDKMLTEHPLSAIVKCEPKEEEEEEEEEGKVVALSGS